MNELKMYTHVRIVFMADEAYKRERESARDKVFNVFLSLHLLQDSPCGNKLGEDLYTGHMAYVLLVFNKYCLRVMKYVCNNTIQSTVVSF